MWRLSGVGRRCERLRLGLKVWSRPSRYVRLSQRHSNFSLQAQKGGDARNAPHGLHFPAPRDLRSIYTL